ncbi:MAG: hypothetical protein ACE5JM_04725 [Armatimonadota bacterium]
MKAATVVLGVLTVVALGPYAWARSETAAGQESLEDAVRTRQVQIEKKMAMARSRIKHKNFVAARSAISDASARVRALQDELPPQRLVARLAAVEAQIKNRDWDDARRALENAFRELDSQARYIDVTKIWQHLDDARGFVAERRGRLALQEVRAAQRFAYIDDISSPLRRALVYLSDARRELLKLPTLFKGKRAAAKRRLDGAEAELGRTYAHIEKLLAGEYATGT